MVAVIEQRTNESEKVRSERDGLKLAATAVVFLFMSVGVVALIRAGRTPFVFLSSDAANIATCMIAREKPALFVGDSLFGDFRNFRLYWTIHFLVYPPLMKALGSYEEVFLAFHAAQLWIQALGFFWFGMIVLRRRRLAFAMAAVLTFWHFDSPGLGDGWGLFPDAIPRTTFQVIVPFLMVGMLRAMGDIRRWAWLVCLAGATAYVHPVSAPAWMLATVICSTSAFPASWSMARRVAVLTGYSFLAALVVLPFALHYLGNHIHGETPDYSTVMEVMRARFSIGLMNVPGAVRWLVFTMYMMLLTAFMVASATIGGVRDVARTPAIRLLVMLVLGIVIGAALIPWLDQVIMAQLQLLPLQIELVRSIRFLPMLVIVAAFVVGEMAYEKLRLTRGIRACHVFTVGCCLIAFLVVVASGVTMSVLAYPREAGEALRRPWARPLQKAGIGSPSLRWMMSGGRDDALSEVDRSAIEAYVFLRDRVAEGGRVLLLADIAPLPIRYFSQRPIVYSHKEGGAFAYSNHEALLRWRAAAHSMEILVTGLRDERTTTETVLRQMRTFDPDVAVLDRADADRRNWGAAGSAVLFENQHFSIVQVEGERTAGGR